MDTFGLKIIASDGVFYEGRCKKLIIPAPDGEKGILANHENMVIAVNVGVAHMSLDGDEWKDIAVGVGFVEIVNNRVTLIVEHRSRKSVQRKGYVSSRVSSSIIIRRHLWQER